MTDRTAEDLTTVSHGRPEVDFLVDDAPGDTAFERASAALRQAAEAVVADDVFANVVFTSGSTYQFKRTPEMRTLKIQTSFVRLCSRPPSSKAANRAVLMFDNARAGDSSDEKELKILDWIEVVGRDRQHVYVEDLILRGMNEHEDEAKLGSSTSLKLQLTDGGGVRRVDILRAGGIGLGFVGCTNCHALDVNVVDYAEDGISVSGHDEKESGDIALVGCTVRSKHDARWTESGIEVDAVRNLLIERCKVTSYGYGLNIRSEDVRVTMSSVVVRDCEFEVLPAPAGDNQITPGIAVVVHAVHGLNGRIDRVVLDGVVAVPSRMEHYSPESGQLWNAVLFAGERFGEVRVLRSRVHLYVGYYYKKEQPESSFGFLELGPEQGREEERRFGGTLFVDVPRLVENGLTSWQLPGAQPSDVVRPD